MLNSLSVWVRQRQSVRALSRLADRELADIGIARSDIRSIVGRATTASQATADADAMAPSWGRHQSASR